MQKDTLKSDNTNKINWHSLSPDEILEKLKANSKGLTATDAAQRLIEHGPNEIKETKQISHWKIFFGQFKSLIIWILIGAGIISGIFGEWLDSVAIISIVILNGIIGFFQEIKAQKSIAALKKMTSPRAKVWRDGSIKIVPASEIVPGDILELEAGDLVAADARLLEVVSFKCIEAALTGESDSVNKKVVTLDNKETTLADRENMIFMGTAVATGTGRAVVVATAMNTEIGHIAELIEEAGEDEGTPLQKKLEVFGRVLVWACLGIVAMLFALGLMRGTPIMEMFMTAVSLAVAAVPEGLPAVVTIAFALGVMRMSRRGALVRKLPAVETLGSTNVICTDKTGTLTVGEMTVRSIYLGEQIYEFTGEGYEPKGEVRTNNKVTDVKQSPLLQTMSNILMGCNNSHLVEEKGEWKVIGDPTEGAMLSAASKAGADAKQFEQEFPLYHQIPFDSDRKRQSFIRRLPDNKLKVFTNGAPDLLLAKCTHLLNEKGVILLTENDRSKIMEQNNSMANQALRVLGSAYRDLDQTPIESLTSEMVEQNLVFVGLMGMFDPPRPEVKVAIEKCHSAGIRVVMITGDHPQTALAIAKDIGITKDKDICMSGAELDKISEEDLKKRISEITVFARVTAEHKLRVIRAWKANNAVVAMTGDGVNDAPAIKGSDIGIAMGKSGTEVTKQASDMIITDDNFTSIVAAVEEGRGIYDNIRKTIQYLLAGNTGELLLMTVCIVIGLSSPLLPIHLLWINLVTDGLPALCLATDPIDPEIMKNQPRVRNEKITNGGFFINMFITGILTAGVSFGVFFYALNSDTPEMAQTYAFTVLVFSELFRAFGARSETRPIWKINLFTNINLLIVIILSFGFQILTHHNTYLAKFLKTSLMSFNDCMVLIAVSTLPMIGVELWKILNRGKKGLTTEKKEKKEKNFATEKTEKI